MRPMKQPPSLEAIACIALLITLAVCSVCYGVQRLVASSNIVMPKPKAAALQALSEPWYVLGRIDQNGESGTPDPAVIRAPNERAARMRLAIYEHDSLWEDGTKAYCIPISGWQHDMVVRRKP